MEKTPMRLLTRMIIFIATLFKYGLKEERGETKSAKTSATCFDEGHDDDAQVPRKRYTLW